jgi:hypothetical protein
MDGKITKPIQWHLMVVIIATKHKSNANGFQEATQTTAEQHKRNLK